MAEIESASHLRESILAQYDDLSPRLQQIAQFVLDDPHSMGVETLAVLSARIKVPPSAIVRFAKTFGFDGAGAMQRLLKDGLLASSTASAYHQRLRSFSQEAGENPRPGPQQLLAEFARSSILALEHLAQAIPEAALAEALDLIVAAEMVHACGFRRSYPAATYLTYLLQQAGKRTALVDGVGGYTMQQARQIGADDLLVVISYSPYATEAIEIAEAAFANGARILAITDSPVSAVARHAACVLDVRDGSARGFRNLAASMCVCQSLAIAYAIQSDQPAD